jgi:hypothetical protein
MIPFFLKLYISQHGIARMTDEKTPENASKPIHNARNSKKPFHQNMKSLSTNYFYAVISAGPKLLPVVLAVVVGVSLFQDR